MHGRLNQWLAWTPVVAAMVCSFSATARGQANRLSVDPAYQMPVNSTQMAPNYPTTAANNYMVSSTLSADEKGLADEVAELKAWKKKVEDKEKADKKKAAGSPSVKVGGRIFVDTAMFAQNAASTAAVGNAENGAEFRAARLELSGAAFDVIDYKMQFGLDGVRTVGADTYQATKFKDVYIGINELPLLGHARVGHFKEPFGMEQLTSSKYTTFMERSILDSAFVPSRNTGVMAYDWSENERMTWAIGAFVNEQRDDPPFINEDKGNTALTMRCSFLPWYDEATEGRGLLHTGLAYSYRAFGDGTANFRSRPEANLAPYVVSTGNLPAEDVQLVGAEVAYLYGSFSAQTEYMAATVNPIDGNAGEYTLNGYYVFFSYFLTGEHRPYDRQLGTFNKRIEPFENFFRVRTEDGNVVTGRGAWELGYRYSYLDLNGGAAAGGLVSDHTFGVNWYLTPYTRMMFNYVNSTSDFNGQNDAVMDIFEMRAQVDF